MITSDMLKQVEGKIRGEWLVDLSNQGLNDKELAAITYAVVYYSLTKQKLRLSDIFEDFGKTLDTYAMPALYTQMDKMSNYKGGEATKYDSDAIYQLRLEGKTAKQICEILGYDEKASRSLTSNKGWVRANQDRKSNKIQK